MDIKEAMTLAVQDYPNMEVVGAAENDLAWIFGLDFKGTSVHPSEIGLPSIAVDKSDSSCHLLTPGTDAFWKHRTPGTKSVPLPVE